MSNRRRKRGTYQLILLTEDATGNLSEMGSRLESGQWPTTQTVARVIRRCTETIQVLRKLRRELGWRLDQEDEAA